MAQLEGHREGCTKRENHDVHEQITEEGIVFSPPKPLQQRALIPATKLNKNVSQESTPKEDSNENPHHLFTLEEDTNVNKQKDCHLPKTT